MSLIKSIRKQLGLSVTPANNFTLTAEADNGTMKLARGNAGATTQDIMTVDAAGKVAFPQNPAPPAFRAYLNAAAVPNAALVIPATLTQDFDLGGDFFTSATSRYQPSVAGYYQFNALIDFTGLPANGYIKLRRNGVVVGGAQGNNYMSQGAALVRLNGTTDYVDIVIYQSSGAALNANIEFSGFLARTA